MQIKCIQRPQLSVSKCQAYGCMESRQSHKSAMKVPKGTTQPQFLATKVCRPVWFPHSAASIDTTHDVRVSPRRRDPSFAASSPRCSS